MYFTWIEKQVLITKSNLSQFFFLEITPVLVPNIWAIENSLADTYFQELNSGPYDCQAYALPHDNGHTTKLID